MMKNLKTIVKLFSYSSLVFSILTGIVSIKAENYFDPAFLNILGKGETVDLSVFSEKGSIAEGEYPVSIFINQRSVGQFNIQFQKNAIGKTSPLLTPDFLDKMGVNVKIIPYLKDIPGNQSIDDLSEWIPQAKIIFDLSHLRLDINIPQVAMKLNLSNDYNPSLWEEGITAFLANYNLSIGRTNNRYNNINLQYTNLYSTARMGINTGAWRLRNTINYMWSESNSGITNRQIRFSNTNISRGINQIRSTILIGETSTGSDIFDGVLFKGIQLTSNEQMLPNQLRGFAPAVSGFANSNARITVRQNGNIIYETYVAQGAFYINDIQQAGMSGDYDVTITETDGSERQFIVPYSSLPIMLRPGGGKYEFSAGRYDGHLTRSSRETDFILATGVYGFPQNFTLYAGTLFSILYQSANFGMGTSLGNVGAISADITHSNAQFKNNSKKIGESYRLRYSKSLVSTGTSVDLTALRYSTRDYLNFNEFNSNGYQLETGVNPWIIQHRRSSFQTQISQRMQDWGSMHFRFNRDDYWGSEKVITGVSVGYSNTSYGVSYGINYDIDRIKDSQNNWPENRQISANISIPFSLFGNSFNLQSIYATNSFIRDNSGRERSNTGVSGSFLDGNASYNLSQSWGNQGEQANSYLNFAYQGSKGMLSAGYSYSDQSRSMNMNAGGGVLIHSDGILFSRYMGESVALISAPGAFGTSVNNGIGITNSKGYAVAPFLSSYTKNSIGLDPSTLPDDIDLVQTNINVYPTKGAVVKADFKTRIGYQVLLTLQFNDEIIPFGAIATLDMNELDVENSGIVGDLGQVYFTGLPPKGNLYVKWGEKPSQQCLAHFDIHQLAMDLDVALRQATITCLPFDKKI